MFREDGENGQGKTTGFTQRAAAGGNWRVRPGALVGLAAAALATAALWHATQAEGLRTCLRSSRQTRRGGKPGR